MKSTFGKSVPEMIIKQMRTTADHMDTPENKKDVLLKFHYTLMRILQDTAVVDDIINY